MVLRLYHFLTREAVLSLVYKRIRVTRRVQVDQVHRLVMDIALQAIQVITVIEHVRR